MRTPKASRKKTWLLYIPHEVLWSAMRPRIAFAARVDPGAPCWRCMDFRLPRERLFHYRSIDHKGQMLFARIVPLIAVLSWITAAYANVPIIIETGDAKRKVMKLCGDASNQLREGDVASAKRNINEALRIDPKLWPALYVRAEIFAREGKYELAIQDCNEALRQNRAFIDAALLRARINVALGKYAEASKEYDSLIAMHPATVTLARALSDRALFQATCLNASFRNGQQAVKDAKAACSIVAWKDEDMIDTLAVAYAETGDFDSAVRYAQQALGIKNISARVSKRIQSHLALFQRRQPVRSG